MTNLIIACIAFLGTHFALSHPLRAPIVARVGEQAFLGLYSLVAAVTMTWMVLAYRAAPAGAIPWVAGDVVWTIASVVMLIGSILFAGSLIGNPALPDPTGKPMAARDPRGVFAITRHPMMWGFALWGLVHIAVWPTTANTLLAGSITILALAGARLQDIKKMALVEGWRGWMAATSFTPFGAIAGGRVRPGAAWPGLAVVLGGIVLWAVASWAHWPLAEVAAGPMRWLGW